MPLASRAAAAEVVRSATAPGSVKAAARTAALAAAFAAGAAPRLLRDRLVVDLPAGASGVDEELSTVLGRPVVVGLRVGPPRANRKPVLQVVSPTGELLAYAKLGVSPLTDALVNAEGRALTRLGVAILGQVKIPEVLHAGQWQGHPLLVQSALPVRRSTGADAGARITRAMVTVARAEGSTPTAVRDLPWWAATREAVDALPPGPHATGLAGIGARLDELADRVVPSGAWHGDWNPGNCAVLPDAVLVWDWERYEAGVPAGFDALHLSLQASIGGGIEPSAAAGRVVVRRGRAARTLRCPLHRGAPRVDALSVGSGCALRARRPGRGRGRGGPSRGLAAARPHARP